MISSVSKLVISSLFLFVALCSYGKEVGCYKLVDSSDPNIKVGAIQFISFIGDQCYESDSNGTSIKNGTMQKNGYQSSRETTVYSGTCFCGGGAKFEFNINKTHLTVTSKNKKVYKFKQIPKPQNVSTCSIIRNHNDSGGDYYFVDNINNGGYDHNPNSSYENNNSNNSSTNQGSNSYTTKQRKCVYCNGTGQITKNDNAPANFGIEKPRQKCSTCGEWYNPNVFNHYHIQCRHCSGTGFAK